MNHNSLEHEEEEKYFDEAERANFIRVLSGFKNYKRNCFARIDKRLCYLTTLPLRQQLLLEKYKKTLNTAKQCVEQNQRIIEKFLSGVDTLFVNSKNDIVEPQASQMKLCDPDNDKVIITLKQIVRDWTALGAEERNQSYKPILDEICQHFDIDKMEKNQYRILVPGAGLARLVYEISLRGFYCEGNEFSLFMLIASNFLLNRCLMNDCHEFFPYCHNFLNNLNRHDPLLSCNFPDVSPFQNPPRGISIFLICQLPYLIYFIF